MDPNLARAALQFYIAYRSSQQGSARQPMGVIINQQTLKVSLVFKLPILLPEEVFIPISELQRIDFMQERQ